MGVTNYSGLVFTELSLEYKAKLVNFFGIKLRHCVGMVPEDTLKCKRGAKLVEFDQNVT